jgi:hypothetical protein
MTIITAFLAGLALARWIWAPEIRAAAGEWRTQG